MLRVTKDLMINPDTVFAVTDVQNTNLNAKKEPIWWEYNIYSINGGEFRIRYDVKEDAEASRLSVVSAVDMILRKKYPPENEQ